jgi:hypothetical protein
MRGLIKALILGWIGKKILDRVTYDGREAPTDRTPRKQRAATHRKASSRRTARKTTRRAA